ncbi:aldo/keto reductase [Spongiactinospora sp. TRM90649]|uniref:aldo/keto reductase n=1 Tax=Spongiactinospora sp. TRM90649 TaxID=3031114 RepID=UPI0023F6C3C3|nr:aldo/keto reductase [Spongiactinospora sp. TRM90649]MDF5757585.1 aldo/keto reductase [Spongiactinospora sp. TRM90649]
MTPRTITIGGDLTINRLGFGAMRLTGPNIWGPPADLDGALAVARRAVELGVNHIDTADSYGPGVSEELLAEALHPYPEGLLIGTKAGQTRPSPTEWKPVGRPEYLRQQVELSLRRLRLETIDLFWLHRVDPQVPAAEQYGALARMRDEGKVRHVGLSQVTVAQIEEARETVEIVGVQNLYNLTTRTDDDVLDHCTREGLMFVPWLPIAAGAHAASDGTLAEVAAEVGATPVQVSLAWMLHRSPVVCPIPGTASVAHLEENLGAADVTLTDEQYDRLAKLG